MNKSLENNVCLYLVIFFLKLYSTWFFNKLIIKISKRPKNFKDIKEFVPKTYLCEIFITRSPRHTICRTVQQKLLYTRCRSHPMEFLKIITHITCCFWVPSVPIIVHVVCDYFKLIQNRFQNGRVYLRWGFHAKPILRRQFIKRCEVAVRLYPRFFMMVSYS